MNISDLSQPFDRNKVHWRAQTLTNAGDKAMALAYIDARDVMNRLDEVCGPESWQSRYSHADGKGGKTVCEIGIKIGDEWVWKANGAGDSDIEGEKGALSDAFKRAAVCWGIGRYLYDLETPWVPCETYERGGKKVWKKWTADPWNFVRGAPSEPAKQPAKHANSDGEKVHNWVVKGEKVHNWIVKADTKPLWVNGALKLIETASEFGELAEIQTANEKALNRLAETDPEAFARIETAIKHRHAQLFQAAE